MLKRETAAFLIVAQYLADCESMSIEGSGE
jgi:hypothetical protein